jgi:hypothetical protein
MEIMSKIKIKTKNGGARRTLNTYDDCRHLCYLALAALAVLAGLTG